MTDNPTKILQCLDWHLTRETAITIYGRAALALGFPPSQPQFTATLDVDLILPEVQLNSIDADEQFWQAVERVNSELDSSGLYLTHLFVDTQIILSPNWADDRQGIAFPATHLRILRPSVEDLILSKMMRTDPQDREDIRFLTSQPEFSESVLHSKLAVANVPPVSEIESAFQTNRAWLADHPS